MSLLLAIMTAPLWGQAEDSPIVFYPQDGVTTTFVSSPSLGNTTTSSSGDDHQWLKIEFHYNVLPPKHLAPGAPVPNFIDSVDFHVWVEGRDLLAPDAPTKDGIAVGLTGSVTYVNIPIGRDQYGVFYVHPATLSRYSTTTGKTDFDRKFNIHVEASINGAKMDYIDKKKEDDLNWYTQLRAISGLVFRQDQCPFMLTDPDRYPQIKLSDSGGSVSSAPTPPPTPPPAAATTPPAPGAQ